MMAKRQELRGYKIFESPSEGAWKTTYPAQDLVVGLKVALKRYKKLSREKLVRLWQREGLRVEDMRARDLLPMGLPHPHILACSWTFDDKGEFWIIEPWLDTMLEKVVLEKGRLSHGEFMLYARGMAAGLSYCHRAGIVHGDIKMDNIGIKDNKAVHCDFGIASLLSPVRIRRYNPGTIRTRAPELFGKGVSITKQSDIWAVGCVFFAMLTGEYPFIGREERIPAWDDEAARREFERRKRDEIRRGSATLHTRIRNEVSELYWEVLESCLQYDPGARVTARGLVGKLRQTTRKLRKYVNAMKREHELVRNLEQYATLAAEFRYDLEDGRSSYEIQWPGGGEGFSFWPREDVADYLPFLTFEDWVSVTPDETTAYALREGSVRLSSYAKEILKILARKF